MSDQFMQEVQEEEHSIEDLERKISQGTGIGEAAADDMIRANEEAQAIEVDTLKDTVLAYQRQIEELKELYDKNRVLVDEMRKMSIETTKGVQDVMKASAQALSDNSNALHDVDFGKMQEDSRKSTEEASKKLEEKLTESIEQSQQKIADLLQQSDDFSHKENVRVYRNVQAAVEQLLKKQTEDLKEKLDEEKQPSGAAVSGVQIATLVAVLAGVILEALHAFGVLSMFFG